QFFDFLLQPTISLAGTTTGITVRAFPPTKTKLEGYRLDVVFTFLNTPTCTIGMPGDVDFEFTVGFDNVAGIASSFSQRTLNIVLDLAHTYCTGVRDDDLVLQSVQLFNPSSTFIQQLDGLAVSR